MTARTSLKSYCFRLAKNPFGIAAKIYGVWRREGLAGLRQRVLDTRRPVIKYPHWMTPAKKNILIPTIYYNCLRFAKSPYRSLSKIYGVWRREGLAGFRKRIHDIGGPTIMYLDWMRLGEKRNVFCPTISVISAVYNKQREVPFFIRTLQRQTYKGHVEIIFVDDCSSDDTVTVIKRYAADDRRITCLTTEANIGQCGARNLGIQRARGDILIIMDGDHVVNRGFLKAHAERHVNCLEADVVIGPYNIETGPEDPLKVLARYEKRPRRCVSEMKLQDPANVRSFVNCITRNFSIKRSFLKRLDEQPLFDEAFSYTAQPDSGFGWEDVEMGFRLYQKGARVDFEPGAFSIHISHPSTIAEHHKPVGSIKNFRKLLEKHPDFPLVAKHWTHETFQKIAQWLDHQGHRDNEDKRRIEAILSDGSGSSPPAILSDSRKLNILTYRWHCGHQYELYKLPHEFVLSQGLTTMTLDWDYKNRPLRSNARLVPLRFVKIQNFDLAILHFDENSLSQEHCQGIIPPDWGTLFQYLKSNLKIPMVAICHGTPSFYGQYDFRNERPDLVPEVIEEERQRMVEFLSDTLVICNSHQAQKEWGFRRSKVIWHGLDPAEYPPALYEKSILTVGGAMRHRPHYRGYYLFRKAVQGIHCDTLSGDMPETDVRVPEPPVAFADRNDYAYHRFRNYVDLIREYSVFFNPTIRSPMPRCRGEAMLCGLAVVTANNHDANMFIKNGVNGFYGDDADELHEYLQYVTKSPARAEQIGREGRKTAMKVFDINRYLNEWQETIEDLTGERSTKTHAFHYAEEAVVAPEFSVAYVSGRGGDTQRYRCRHMAEYLATQRIPSRVIEDADQDLEKKVAGHDLIVLHRVPMTDQVRGIVEHAKASGAKIIFETDDLIFDESLKEYFDHVLNLTDVDFKRHLKTIHLCDYAICSTDALGVRFDRLGKKAFVVRNAVSDDLIVLSSVALENRQHYDSKVIIGYGSGTPTHNMDFLEAADALVELFKKYQNLELQIIGHLEIDARFAPFGDRVIQMPAVPWRKYPFRLREFDINIAPFQKTPFCQCKSELKYFEAALLRIPTVASDIDSYRYAIRHGENGFLAGDPGQWYESLEQLVLDPILRVKMGNRAFEDVQENYYPEVRARQLMGVFRNILSKT